MLCFQKHIVTHDNFDSFVLGSSIKILVSLKYNYLFHFVAVILFKEINIYYLSHIL